MNVIVRGKVKQIFDPKEGSKSFTFTVGSGISVTSFGNLREHVRKGLNTGDFVIGSGNTNLFDSDNGQTYHSVILNGEVTKVTPYQDEEIPEQVFFTGVGKILSIDYRSGKKGDYAFVEFKEDTVSFRGQNSTTYKLSVFDQNVLRQLQQTKEGDHALVQGIVERNKSGESWYTNYRVIKVMSVGLHEVQPEPETHDDDFVPPYGDAPSSPQESEQEPEQEEEDDWDDMPF